MKRGLILYLTEGSEKLPEWMDVEHYREDLCVNALCLAASEAEIHHFWWHLATRGMHHISCMWAEYDEAEKVIHIKGEPLRLAG